MSGPLSNYPRPHDPRTGAEPVRGVWTPDLVVGTIGLLSLAASVVVEGPTMLRGTPPELRTILVGVLAAFFAVAIALQILLVYRRRWGMWVLLGLTGVSLASTAGDGLSGDAPLAYEVASLGIEIVTFLYVAARLLVRLGPRPR